MEYIGAFNAKTHFSQLLVKVEEEGVSYVITKHGSEVAMLVPIKKAEKIEPSDKIHHAIHSIKQLRRGVTLGPKLTVNELRSKGRR